MDKDFLRKKADFIRDDLLRVCINNKTGHIAPSLSCVDILTALYYDVLNYKTEQPLWEARDRLIFSKAHGCYALYAILCDKGIIPKEEWEGFYTAASSLSGCIEIRPEYGLEAGCGSLGHGLPIAAGLAFGAKLQGKSYHIFCVVGDGELQEGSNWEALQFAVKHELTNLTIIIDNNRLQAMDFIINIMDRQGRDIIRKFKGFGLSPVNCPGHDVVKLAKCLRQAKLSPKDVPAVIIARTIKGYGLKCMENIAKFHFRIPTQEEIKKGKNYG
ncbi:MAG: transketolase [Candidatus Omnitrophota bacterium]|nr:MAG: transketolase [Candidatus Omnitrophota bacterium]